MVPTSRLPCASATIAAIAIAALPGAGFAAPPGGDVAVVEADPQTATFVGESTYQVQLHQVARRFYADHPDAFDTLIVTAAFSTPIGGEADYEHVANDVTGLNIDLNGLSAETFDIDTDKFGSERLEGVIHLADLPLLPESPDAPLLGRWSALDLLAQEVAHRYGAYVWFSDDGQPSDALLGRDRAHWSFFADTGGSPLGGNGWTEDVGGAWRTVEPTYEYAAIDLYLMGLLPADEVPAVRLLTEPVVTTKSLDPSGRPFGRDSNPSPGVIVQGTWAEVSVDQIVAVETARSPSAAQTDPIRRHAFIALHRAGDGGIDDAAMARLETLRSAWVRRYAELTGGRGRVIATLDGRDELPRFPTEPLRHGWRRDDDAWIHDGLRFDAQDGAVAAVRGEGVGLVRFRPDGGDWSVGVRVKLPGVAELSDDDGWSGVVTGLRVDPVQGEAPPAITALDVGPADEVAANLPGDGGPSCACSHADEPWLLWAWSRRRG